MRPVPKSNLCGQFKRQLTKLTAKLNLNLYLSKGIQPHDWHIIDSTWLSTINTRIHEGESVNDVLVVTWSGLWQFSIRLLPRPPWAEKLQDDEPAIATLQPATHFPDTLSQQTEASGSIGSIVTTHTWSVGGHTQTLANFIAVQV